jgi:hypothetical protein
MQKILMVTATLVMVILAGPAQADSFFAFFTGNDLHEQCSGSNVHQVGLCTGYIVAATDAASYVGRTCPPNGTVGPQATDIVNRYLRDHPENRHLAAYPLAEHALAAAWPCP